MKSVFKQLILQMIDLKLNKYRDTSNYQSLEVVCRGSEKQL